MTDATTAKAGTRAMAHPPLILGGNVFGWTVSQEQAFPLLDAALDAGLNMIDSADVYSAFAPGNKGGESETVLGAWINARRNRERVSITTKVGLPMPNGKGLTAAWIQQGCEDSLRRLQTDYIDTYMAHIDDPATPLEETLGAFARLIEQGKVRRIGASNYGAARVREALDVSAAKGLPRYSCVQVHYNLIERSIFEGPFEQLAEKEGLEVQTYYALASGFLTGKYRSEADLSGGMRQTIAKRYFNPRNLGIIDALEGQARRLGVPMAQVAIAWVMARPSVTAPVASATSVAQLEGLIAATRLRLDAEAMQALDNASAPVAA